MQSAIKSWSILAFLTAFLILAAACGSEEPSDTNAASFQSADKITKAAERLWDDWFDATQKHDASAVHKLLARNITDRCTLKQMERFFAMDDDAFTYPEMDVVEVFVAAGNTDNAIMTMKLRNEPADGDQGIRDAYVASIPYSVVKEDGRWRMVFQIIVIGDGCPFEGSFSSQEAVPIEGSDSGSR